MAQNGNSNALETFEENKQLTAAEVATHILDLPTTVLMDIFDLLSYDDIAKLREVCVTFNNICGQLLNAGFNKVVNRHSTLSKYIKMKLPRRESERREHNYSRHADVLSAVETRISMLALSYNKYISSNCCCFIPGRVLDELNRVLNVIQSTTCIMRPNELLQELRDISSMATEHFEDHIRDGMKLQEQEKQIEAERQKFDNKLRAAQLSDEHLSITTSVKSICEAIDESCDAMATVVTKPMLDEALRAFRNEQIDMNKRLSALTTTQINDFRTFMRKMAEKMRDLHNRVYELEHNNQASHPAAAANLPRNDNTAVNSTPNTSAAVINSNDENESINNQIATNHAQLTADKSEQTAENTNNPATKRDHKFEDDEADIETLNKKPKN